jgi:hypothetical protein
MNKDTIRILLFAFMIVEIGCRRGLVGRNLKPQAAWEMPDSNVLYLCGDTLFGPMTSKKMILCIEDYAHPSLSHSEWEKIKPVVTTKPAQIRH